MAQKKSIEVRGYLIHMTHYDPVWYGRKEQEKRFDLKLACDMVKAMGKAGLNTLIIDVEDGVEYRTFPELKRHYSAPMGDLVKLVECARGVGMHVIPKLNFSKGDSNRHNEWFSPYHKMGDTPEYWAKAFKLIDELIGVVKPEKFVHIGMDEDSERTPEEYVAAVTALHDGLAKRNLRAVMWNDTPHRSASMFGCVEKTLAAEDRAAKDIPHIAWDYGKVQARTTQRIKDMVKKGLEVWIAPGGYAEDVAAWKQVALATGCAGMVMTAWAPVQEAGRKDFMERIEKLGPIYSSTEVDRSPSTVDREQQETTTGKVETARIVAQGNMKPVTKETKDEILAPNSLGEPVGEEPYLLPGAAFVRNWMVLGPYPFKREAYPGPEHQEVIDEASFIKGNEAELVAQKDGTAAHGATWKKFRPGQTSRFPQVIDLVQTYGRMEYAAAYLVAHVHSERAVKGYSIYLGSDDYARVWVDGQLVYTYAERSRAIGQDDDKIEGIALAKGWNKVVVKCVNLKATWGLLMRFADEKGRALVTR